MNLREIINERLHKVRSQPDMPPSVADEYATELSAMLSTLSDKEAQLRQQAYGVMIMAIEGDKPIGQASALMKASQEYREYKQAEGMYKSVLEVIRSLRGKIRAAEQQYKENIN